MRTQPASKENPATGIVPPVCPNMPWRVAKVEVLPEFRLRVVFLDGLDGTVEMATLVHSQQAGVFAPLADPAVFAQAHVENGAVTWPDEIDLAPDAMYRAIKARGVWTI